MGKHKPKNVKPTTSNPVHDLLTQHSDSHEMSKPFTEEVQVMHDHTQKNGKSSKLNRQGEADKPLSVPPWQQAAGKKSRHGQSGFGKFQSQPRSVGKNYYKK